jgi:hypothetical protein
MPHQNALPSAKRIVIRLQDGLGNQLFQYALGRRLALDRKVSLYLDASWYVNPRQPLQSRTIGLTEFNIDGELSFDSRWSEAWLPRGIFEKLRWRVEQRFFPLTWRQLVQESPADYLALRRTFDERILNVHPGCYLIGWWVSPRYFEGIEGTLRGELTLREESVVRLAPHLAEVAGGEAVSIHVRRGDYSRHPEIGLLDRAYYERALEVIRSKVSNPSFFVFSDDVTGAKELLRGLGQFRYVALGEGFSAAMNLWLMAACKHFINANSTFSWWGAWLAKNPDKVIVVPENWFVGAKVQVADVYPSGWIQLPL